ncbi:MAG: lytic transglycosylase [Desulfuromonas sp.]|nr:MAG: lytic transglycosylase [Desulfuromonas sp.]
MAGFKQIIILALFLLLLPSAGFADIYKYVDNNGVIHFTNTPTRNHYKLYQKENGRKLSVQDVIQRYADFYRLDKALVNAVIKVESDFNPNAVSRKGALGMMQLIPTTAQMLKVKDPLDPEDNIRGGSRYLRMMLDQFKGNLDLALAAYNAGPTAVRNYGGIPPYTETIRYVDKVKHYLDVYRQNRGAVL